jgi:GNAT superfamily N-acetyltransferase
MKAQFDIRSMTRSEVDIAIEWAAAEGWNPGLHDAEVFHQADPEGFLLAHVQGEPVGVCSAVRYGQTFGFFGLYIVAPKWRGFGIGLALWAAAMRRLHGRIVGLDGVVAQQHNYARSGFELAYRQVRHRGLAWGGVPRDPGLVPLAAVDIDCWLAYDRKCFPAERRAYIEPWVKQPDTVALALVEAGQLQGYGAIRPCRTGYKVGPLFADSPTAAQRLLAGLQSAVPLGSEVYVDTPEPHREAMMLASRNGMEPMFETARMYAGGHPVMDTQRQFAVTSFELG